MYTMYTWSTTTIEFEDENVVYAATSKGTLFIVHTWLRGCIGLYWIGLGWVVIDFHQFQTRDDGGDYMGNGPPEQVPQWHRDVPRHPWG